MVFAVDQRRQRPGGDRVRLLLRLRDRGQRLGADPVQFGLVEVGALDNVGQQVERRAEIGGQRRQGDVRTIGTAGRRDLGAEPLFLLGQLLAG